jgi:hypothetical protein
MQEKFKVPTEMIDLPSKGKLYPEGSELSKGVVEMSYMTAKHEDVLTNVNLLRKGTAIETVLKMLIQSPIKYEDLIVGDRDALMIASRILAYGSEYPISYTDPGTNKQETHVFDLSTLDHKEVDVSLYSDKNEFEFTLPHTKNVITFKMMTVADDDKVEEEIEGVKKATGVEPGRLSMKLKHQITSINGEYSTKAVRDFIDGGYLLAKDSLELRRYISKLTPSVNTSISFTSKSGEEVTMELPMSAEFFFPG